MVPSLSPKQLTSSDINVTVNKSGSKTSICITSEQRIQGTDGYAMFVGRDKSANAWWPNRPGKKILIRLHAKIPTNCDLCELEWYDDDNGVLRCSKLDSDKPHVLIAFESRYETKANKKKKILAELYPDLAKLVPSGAVKPAGRITLGSDHMKRPTKVYGTHSVTFENRGTDVPLCVTPLSGFWEQFEAVLVIAQMSLLPDEDTVKVALSDELSLPGLDELDDLYDQAKELVIETRKASISYVQRRISVGYNRAARIVEQLERHGVVSPTNSSGVREVLE